jgi:tryptophan synthase alpha chain
MVSSSSTTGASKKAGDFNREYFERIHQMKLKNPRLIGFGISDRSTFLNACKYANGAIIGSAFIKAIQQDKNITENIADFVKKIHG